MAKPVCSLPGANGLQNSLTVPKFTKFLSDTGVINSVNARINVANLRSSYLLWNASAQNENGVCQFSPIHAKTGYHSNIA